MWRAIGWLLVFLFPIFMVYITGGPDKVPLLDDDEYVRRRKIAEKKKNEQEKTIEQTKKSKKNKKKKNTSTVVPEVNPVVEEKPKVEQKPEPKKKNKKNKVEQQKAEPVAKKPTVTKKQENPIKEPVVKKEEPTVKKEEPIVKKEDPVETPVKEIDEHMDPTAHYARVLRIRPEEVEDEWESVPYEEGWSQVKTRRPAASTSKSAHFDVNAEINSSFISNSPLDKKQRENLARAQKKKAAKLAADKLQEERLRKHKKELEKNKIQEFYSSGKGKNTPWGKNAKSKSPQSVASINEFGQLIWE